MDVDEGERPTSATLKMTFWWDESETIRMVIATTQGEIIQGSLVEISDNPRRANGHPHLFELMAEMMRQAGVAAPGSE
ncbi:hypothetical protein ACFQX4_17330 [Roseomonas sp. GCM10028921]